MLKRVEKALKAGAAGAVRGADPPLGWAHAWYRLPSRAPPAGRGGADGGPDPEIFRGWGRIWGLRDGNSCRLLKLSVVIRNRG